MGGVLYSQTIDDVRDELDKIQYKSVAQTEQKDREESDEDYVPATDKTINLDQEIEDVKLGEKIGKYMDAVKQIKDDDPEDDDYNPDNDDYNYAKDEEDDAWFDRDEEEDKDQAKQPPLRRSKRKRRQTAPNWKV